MTMSRPFTEAEREKFLAETRIAVLSIATDDGRPPASVPIWYNYTPGGDILITTRLHSRKAKLIMKAGAATVTVQQEEKPYQYVIVEGTLVDTVSPTPPQVLMDFAIRYHGPEDGPKYAQMDNGETVLLVIRPDRWITADFSSA